jgi:putative ABC transport system substrate-binding protein
MNCQIRSLFRPKRTCLEVGSLIAVLRLTHFGHRLASHVALTKPIYPLSKHSLRPVRWSVLSLGASMRRRDFITALAGAAAIPLAARAQQLPVIGFLSSRSPGESAALVLAFRNGLREAGFVEGQNLTIAFRWAEGRYERLPGLAAELVGLRVNVLFTAGGTPSAVAAKAATSSIPIVFSALADPVRSGVVTSLSRPGANITGMSVLSSALVGKRIELLKGVAPPNNAIGYLLNPHHPMAQADSNDAGTAARTLGLQLRVLEASTEDGLDAAYSNLVANRAGGLAVAADPFLDSRRDKIVALSARHGIIALYPFREYVAAGGLMSYGPSIADSYRQAGIYAGRILKGEKPADLPVMQPVKYDLVLNSKTAKIHGLQFPATLIALADEVIE